jgi:primosomal protein N' (replication factor Y)
VAQVKPLKLKQERVLHTRSPAVELPFAAILVEHQVVHLEEEYEYFIPEEFSARAVVGSLVEVEFGRLLTRGIILKRSVKPKSAGELKEVSKVLSVEPYVTPEQIALIRRSADLYGTNSWDFIRACIPAYSKTGERNFTATTELAKVVPKESKGLPQTLTDFLRSTQRVTCVIELPSSNPYWDLIVEISIERVQCGSVLLLCANERELNLIESALRERGEDPLTLLASSGVSERYANFLRTRSSFSQIILGLRSSVLSALPEDSTIIVVDDVDESHYERRSPTWNTRELTQLREGEHSVIYVSTTISLEIADRVLREDLPLYRFPLPAPIKFHSASETSEAKYFELIGKGLRNGSVLISVGQSGYVTSFACQNCLNIALCSCGGKLYLPKRGVSPKCSTCATESIEWSCEWCHGTKPRAIRRGVARRAEEYGRAFPGRSVIHSSAESPVQFLAEGKHLVLSTPGLEPRGIYSAIIFLDIEARLLRTTLRAQEDLRLQIQRTLSMIERGGDVYIDLPPAEPFLQSVLRHNPLLAAQRELDSRSEAGFLPTQVNIVLSGDGLDGLDGAKRVVSPIVGIETVGPFLRGGKESLLIKAPRERRSELINVLRSLNRVQSMRKEGLLTYQIDPYSLN